MGKGLLDIWPRRFLRATELVEQSRRKDWERLVAREVTAKPTYSQTQALSYRLIPYSLQAHPLICRKRTASSSYDVFKRSLERMRVKSPTEKSPSAALTSHRPSSWIRDVFSTVAMNRFDIPSEPEHMLNFRSRQEMAVPHPRGQNTHSEWLSLWSPWNRGALPLPRGQPRSPGRPHPGLQWGCPGLDHMSRCQHLSARPRDCGTLMWAGVRFQDSYVILAFPLNPVCAGQ